MQLTHSSAVAATGLAALLALTACSSAGSGTSDSSGPQPVPSASGEGETLTVWMMIDDYSDATLEAINDEFTAETGAEVDVQVQSWDDITTKITTALSTSTPPDVLDLGNTQVSAYAANGGLLDLTPYADDLRQGREWLAGLEEPATVDGSLYAVPGFAGARAVIYNKTMWAAAGVTEVPTDWDSFTAALDAVKAANPSSDFSAFYYPGAYWQSDMQFVWDAGAEITTAEGDEWTAGLSSEEAQQGLADFVDFRDAYSTPGSATLDNQTPDQNQVFADGKASAILNTSGGIARILAANPGLTEADLGTFPFPGISGENQPVLLGGSDWGIATKSQNSDLALNWVKIATSPEIQDTYVYGGDGWIPNSTEAIEAAQASGLPELQKGFFEAALSSRATPAAADWSTIEGDNSIAEFFSAIASGDDPAATAEEFDAHLDEVLNSK